MDATDEQPKRKRPAFRQESRKKPKAADDGPSGAFSGFGAKMMAKMGYKSGEGLGKDGSGIKTNIEVKLRDRGAGIGAVHGGEKTKQQKEEEKRRRKLNGEEEEVDSSDEEQRLRRKKKGTSTGASTPRTATSRPKKTIFQVERAMEEAGIHIPQVLIDAATGENTNAAALKLRGTDVPFQSSLAARVGRELTAFGDAIEANSSERDHLETEIEQLNAELDSLDIQIMELRNTSDRLQDLQTETDWNRLSRGLLDLQKAYPSKRFDKEAVALVHALFIKTVSSEEKTSNVANTFQELRTVIDPSSRASENSSIELGRAQKRSTPYESLMLSVWDKLFQSALLRLRPDDDSSSSAFLLLFQEWQSILPPFLVQRTVKGMEHRISLALEQWPVKKKALPQWVFPFLPYCTIWSGAFKSKISHLLKIWPIEKGQIPGIKIWKKAFPTQIEHLLISVFLPRLARHLDDFEIDPSNQILDKLNEVLAWVDILSPRVIAELIHVEFFEKKFYTVLHSWLTYEGRNFEEISAWINWWREEVFPKTLADLAIFGADWDNAYTLINRALDMEHAGKSLDNLELPTAEPVDPPTPATPNFSKSVNAEPKSARQEVTELTFKDIVESWCAEENLLLIPLRKADEATGFPMFRLTASATGKGGVVVYFKGDVIYAQNKKDKTLWDPAGLDDGLISRAEGK